tara:strand:- start:88 stop:699 length:612 start_codon:yes stop_codon:yes gene_type:complete
MKFGKSDCVNEVKEEAVNCHKVKVNFEPVQPASVVEDKYTDDYLVNKQKTIGTGGSEMRGIFSKENIKQWNKENGKFEPTQPVSVIEENTIMECKEFGTGKHYGYANGEPAGAKWEPVLPVSMFESEKVFIGKRHHQTEKPQDILEFFLKYWSDEGDTILDPTMGSGSTGVACKKLKRNFVGFELDEKIFKTAKERIKNVDIK